MNLDLGVKTNRKLSLAYHENDTTSFPLTTTHSPNPELSKLLIINGEKYNPKYDGFNSENLYNLLTNIVSFDSNEEIIAPPWSNFNILGSGGAGGLLSRKAVYCGGYSDIEVYSNACFKLGHKVPFLEMKSRRGYASYVVMNNRLFLIGGRNGTDKMATTEFVALDQETFDVGPTLPLRHAVGCATLLSTKKVLVTGGFADNSDKTFIYDFDNSTANWVEGPAMNVKRWGHSCASFNDITIVTGGFFAESIEILSPSNPDFWKFCKFQFCTYK